MQQQQQQMEQISASDDVWLDVFDFFSPFELGLKMALISDRLDALVDVHFKSRKWSLGKLVIRRAIGGNGAEIFNRFFERLPIPEGPPLPGKVISFDRIWISYVDQSVIEFLERICGIFNSSGTNVFINTSDNQSRSLEIICKNIWPLVSGNICAFRLDSSAHFNNLRQFSPAILGNCAKLRSIHSYGLFPEFPAGDGADASSAQAVAKWLLTPRGDGLPKMLHCDLYLAKMEGLKGSFVKAFEPVNFIIRILQSSFSGIEQFELANNLTGERLSLRQMDESFHWLLIRCPIVREEDKWANWEREANEFDWDSQLNRITINFDDSEIGDA
uniref:F-box domain-containing protein n=1 Tax=Globodera pallida TaxID=36090 RepID=A0A183C797_GLOPA